MNTQLDSSYNEVHKLGAAGGLDGDLHEFRITEQGTALITIYEIIPADLSPLGHSPDGSIWDCLFQEIDLATGSILFQWRSSEHYAITDTYRDIPDDDPFDYFHINSVEKDPKGNYLISSRYMHSVTYISGTTGEILWVLGGKRNNFTDLSDGKATGFMYQHDARWHDKYTTITIFDNAAEDGHIVGPYTRGMRIKIDQKKMTAELVNEYVNPQHIFGVSQGSMQVMDNGHVLLGYGNTGAMTEFAANGIVLCDMHFGPQAYFGSGDIQSYRVFKFNWVGKPTTKPDVQILHNKEDNTTNLYVSWNGATEVAKWVLEGADEVGDKRWETIEELAKEGFETTFSIMSDAPTYVRVKGLDSRGKVLGEGPRWNWKQREVKSLLHAAVVFS